jgi:hypothetical protein
MIFNKAKYIAALISLLIVYQSVGAAVTARPAVTSHVVQIKFKSDDSVVSALFLEKIEEESKSDEAGPDRMVGLPLVDFREVAMILSDIHTPKVILSPLEERFDSGPDLCTRHCVFLI